jgi:hypothetical protein
VAVVAVVPTVEVAVPVVGVSPSTRMSTPTTVMVVPVVVAAPVEAVEEVVVLAMEMAALDLASIVAEKDQDAHALSLLVAKIHSSSAQMQAAVAAENIIIY